MTKRTLLQLSQPARKTVFPLIVSLCLLHVAATAADTPARSKTDASPAEPGQREPTLANISYGTHERQVLDFYRAASDKPTPLVFHIHGGQDAKLFAFQFK